jgi:hypothetical protein
MLSASTGLEIRNLFVTFVPGELRRAAAESALDSFRDSLAPESRGHERRALEGE